MRIIFNELKKLRGFPITNDKIYSMRLTIGL